MRTVWLILLVALATSCVKLKSGDYCEGTGWPRCEDEHMALFCDKNIYHEFSCPSGCTETRSGEMYIVSCALAGTAAGDKCPVGFAGFIYCQSDSEALRCGGMTWQPATCAHGCVSGEIDNGAMGSPGSCDE
jgi:hypothetical protein